VNKTTPEEKLQVCTAATKCNPGTTGSGLGQFHEPAAIAVDSHPSSPSYHDIYVYDKGGSRIEEFDPTGEVLSSFGSAGNGECQFATKTEGLHPIAVGPGGVIYVADSSPNGPSEGEGTKAWVEEFEPSAPHTCTKTIQLAELPGNGGQSSFRGLTVDSAGNIYASFFASSGPTTRKFDPSGNLLGTVGFCARVGVLSIDASNDLFIACGGSRTIEEVDPSGAVLRVFGYGALAGEALGLAPYSSPAGDVYVAESSLNGDLGRVLYLPFPPPGPIVLPRADLTVADPIGNTKATLNAEVNPEGKAPKYRFQYVDDATCQADVEAEGPGHCFDHAKSSSEASVPIKEENEEEELFKEHEVSAEIGCSGPNKQKIEAGECLAPETKYDFRVFAKNADGEGNSPVEGEPFTTKEPIEIIAIWSVHVEAEAATLSAEVNPFGIPATGFFEYISEAAFQKNIEEGHDGFLGASESGTIDFGEAEVPTTESIDVKGLTASTTYHYRLKASDLFVEGKQSEEEGTFQTFAEVGKAPLPDERVYEMVSPLDKNSGEVGVPMPSGGAASFTVEPQQASPDGGKATYGSFSAFGENPESAPATSQYLSRLGPPFWVTDDIDPRFEEGYLRDPVVGLSEDLSKAALIVVKPPLTEDATLGFQDLYLRDNETGKLTTVTTKDHTPKVKPTTATYCLTYDGASADFSRVIFTARGALNEGDPVPVESGFNLYEWSAKEGIKLVSILPSGKAAVPKVDTDFGVSGLASVDTVGCGGVKEHLLRHAISADGQRIFWTFEGSTESAKEPLLARVGGKETVRLDKPEGVAGVGGEGKYWDASTDGSKVFFTDTQELTATSPPPLAGVADLYRYDFESPVGSRLTDLSVHGGGAANVRGVIAASEDGSYVYFVAKAALSSEPNSEGAVAEAGKDNLYAWHEGQSRFIAALADEDSSDWDAHPNVQSARLSPDGRHLAFLSVNSLTGYDNSVGKGSHCRLNSLEHDELVDSPRCAEAFLYDFQTNELACVSCNPSGARPLGPARLPSWSTPFEQPRYLSNDGSRLFFDTLDSLNPHDTNEKRDVYEFERPGSGSCNEGSTAFSPSSGGCIFLISGGEKSGETTDESYLLDASANGEGVFFSTRQSLLPTDTDQRFDVYDARVGGQLPPPPPPICEGSCHVAGSEEEAPLPRASEGFLGPGNPAPRPRCHRGQVRRHGRCVKPRKRHRHRRHAKRGARR
jgi:hypothetical protein